MTPVQALVLLSVVAVSYCHCHTSCKSPQDCSDGECCVVYSGFSKKGFIRGHCEPLGGLGAYCDVHAPFNMTWTSQDLEGEQHMTNVYFKCPCEDSLQCDKNRAHCLPRETAL